MSSGVQKAKIKIILLMKALVSISIIITTDWHIKHLKLLSIIEKIIHTTEIKMLKESAYHLFCSLVKHPSFWCLPVLRVIFSVDLTVQSVLIWRNHLRV